MKNSLKARVKKSKVELQTNRYIIIIVLIMQVVCLCSAAFNMIYTAKYSSTLEYIYYGYNYSTLATFGISYF